MTEWGIDTLFNPGKRHMDEEKRRLQSTREEVGDASGGRRVDLDSGKVVIARKKVTPPAQAQTREDEDEAGGSDADAGPADNDTSADADAGAGDADRAEA